VRTKILKEYPAERQVTAHTIGVRDASKRAANDQTIEPRERARNMRLMLGDKLPHGVSAPSALRCRPTASDEEQERLFGCGYAAL
jgi:hypothetical protein